VAFGLPEAALLVLALVAATFFGAGFAFFVTILSPHLNLMSILKILEPCCVA
jgi:hypothetical protein